MDIKGLIADFLLEGFEEKDINEFIELFGTADLNNFPEWFRLTEEFEKQVVIDFVDAVSIIHLYAFKRSFRGIYQDLQAFLDLDENKDFASCNITGDDFIFCEKSGAIFDKYAI